MVVKTSRSKSKSPYSNANLFSILTFQWVAELLKIGYKKPLESDDLFNPRTSDNSKNLTDELEKQWEKELKNPKPSFTRIIFKHYALKLLATLIIPIVTDILKLFQPFLITRIISYFNGLISLKQACIYGALFSLVSVCDVLTLHPFIFYLQMYGMRLRIAATGMIYRKAVIILVIVARMVDFTMLSGLSVIVLTIILQLFMGRLNANFTKITAKVRDERISTTSEILNGIKMIKSYFWEKPFQTLIKSFRVKELSYRAKTFTIIAANYFINYDFVGLIVFISIAMFIYFGQQPLLPSYIVFILSYYNRLNGVISGLLLRSVNQFINAHVSAIRIQEFLLLPEHVPREKDRVENPYSSIEVKNLHSNWTSEGKDFSLKDITFNAGPCDLIAIVGPVGSGKTSLILSLLGEMERTNGDVNVNGRAFYVSQEPWIFPGSIRENILFGKEFKKSKFDKITQICELNDDLKRLPDRDLTLIGDKGLNLSGGQRARISLARSLYHDPDVYLFDDPLSALDTNVGKHIFENCINSYLRTKIRVLVTHHIHYLKDADKIIVLNNGEVQAVGTYYDLLENRNLNLLTMLESQLTKEEQLVEDEKRALLTQRSKINDLERQISTDSGQMNLSRKDLNKSKEIKPIDSDEQRFTGSIGWKTYKSLFKSTLAIITAFLVILLFIITQFCSNASEYFLSYWANQEGAFYLRNQERLTFFTEFCATSNDTAFTFNISRTLLNCKNITKYKDDKQFEVYENRHYFFVIYSIIISSTLGLGLLRSTAFFRYVLALARTLHDDMIDCVLKAKFRFFDLNPIGRILNRFTKDVVIIDEFLPLTLFDFLMSGMVLLGLISTAVFVNYTIILPIIPIFVLLGYVRKYFISSSREVKRLEDITRSPMYVHLTNTVTGLTTIRACQNQDAFCNSFEDYVDEHTKANFSFIAISRWFASRLDMIIMFFTITVVYFCIFGHKFISMTPGAVGLIYSYLLRLVFTFQWCVRQSAELENLLTSVERVIEYSKLESEPTDVKINKLPKNWPNTGEIVFDNVSFAYDQNLPYVLKNVSLKINPNEKIGVVGRTGAGKTTIMQALLRTAEFEGRILIDGINTKDISIYELREHIVTIPQEPMLFSGTVRYNLDPFEKYDDKKIWDVLEIVQLKNTVKEMKDGLNSGLEKNGSNLSAGQKQLFCLARAILKKCKILIIDEATANVDNSTDVLVQKAIRECFKDCTVITIAHRLQTIIDSDRIICLCDGSLIDLDTPYDLLMNKNSILYSLVQQLGVEEFKRLKDLAEAHNYEKNLFSANIKQYIDQDDEGDFVESNENDEFIQK